MHPCCWTVLKDPSKFLTRELCIEQVIHLEYLTIRMPKNRKDGALNNHSSSPRSRPGILFSASAALMVVPLLIVWE